MILNLNLNLNLTLIGLSLGYDEFIDEEGLEHVVGLLFVDAGVGENEADSEVGVRVRGLGG